MPMFKKSMLALLVIGALIFCYSMYSSYNAGENAELTAAEATAEAPAVEAAQVAVYVTGEVNNPGVVYVDFNARVLDAVNKCGGVLPTADVDKVNMAETVKDGMQVKVPEKSTAPQQGIAAAGTTASSADSGGTAARGSSGGSSSQGNNDSMELININTADAVTLEKLKGIGPAMAQRIIDYRQDNGYFQSIEDLLKVKGIGKAKFAKLKDQVTV